MTEKTKKVLVIAAGSVLCLALAVGIGSRFGGHGSVPSGTDPDSTQNTKDPVVNIQDADRPDNPEPVVDITAPDKAADPAAGADSTGTEQTIQTDPIKPEAPEKPAAPSTTPLPENHQAEDVPQEDRNTEIPPSYEPEQTTVTPAPSPNTQGGYDKGGTYVDGFGYIPSSGEGTVSINEEMYENGNKVGSMD